MRNEMPRTFQTSMVCAGCWKNVRQKTPTGDVMWHDLKVVVSGSIPICNNQTSRTEHSTETLLSHAFPSLWGAAWFHRFRQAEDRQKRTGSWNSSASCAMKNWRSAIAVAVVSFGTSLVLGLNKKTRLLTNLQKLFQVTPGCTLMFCRFCSKQPKMWTENFDLLDQSARSFYCWSWPAKDIATAISYHSIHIID